LIEAGPRQYRFTHALVRATLYGQLSGPRRIRLHRQAGEAIEPVYAAHPEAHLGELAYHFAQVAVAGDAVEKAIDYASRAGADALAHLAPDDALRWYRQALEIVERSGEADERDRCALLIGLGDAQRQLGDPVYRETLLDAAEIAQRLDEADLLVRAAVINNNGVFSRLWDVGPERVAVLESARAVTEGQETPERAQVLATLVGELAFCDRARMRSVADEAIALARNLGDEPTLVIVATRLEPSVRSPDNLTQRLALAAEAAAAAERTGDPVLRWTAASQSFMPALEAGDGDLFRERVEMVERLASQIGQPLMRWLAGLACTLREAVAGRFDVVEKFATEALEIGSKESGLEAFMYYVGFLGQMRLDQGRVREIVELSEQLWAAAPDVGQVRSGRALMYCELGRTAEARSILEAEAAEGFRAIAFDLSWANTMNVYARIAAILDDRRAAATLVELIEPWRDQIASSYFGMGSLSHSLGLALATVGRYDEAERAFEWAAEVHEHIRAPALLAWTRLEWARLLSRRDRKGDRERAHDLAHAADAAATKIGAGAIERGAREVLDSLNAQKDRSVH
jgi:tetratricopeptide (TPR) repeat protein